MAKNNNKSSVDTVKVPNLAPGPLKSKMTQREINLSNKAKAQQDLIDQGFDIEVKAPADRTTIKQRNLAEKERAKKLSVKVQAEEDAKYDAKVLLGK